MKTTLYFLPGMMCDQRLWFQVWQQLEQLAPDRFYCVPLAIPTVEGSADVIADIATALNRQIAQANSYLVGFSLGGYLAAAYSLAFPEKVAKLLVVSNMPRPFSPHEIKERKRTIAWLKTHGYPGIPVKRIQAMIHPNAHSNEKLQTLIKAMDDNLGAEQLIYQLGVSIHRENLLTALAEQDTAIHFCVGRDDHLVDINYLQQGVAEAGPLSLSVFDHVGHMLPLEAPQQLAQKISHFFSAGGNIR